MRRSCFVLMDFSAAYKEVYENAIKPAVARAGLSCIRADEIVDTGDILGHILREIQDASLILADLTGNNTNVAYEIGYAHHLGKKTILIAQSLRQVPFDFRNQRIIQYSRDASGLRKLCEQLKNMIDQVVTSPGSVLRKLIVPHTENELKSKYVIAASPLTFRDKKFRQPNVRRPLQEVDAYAEYLGITGLVQAFGIIFGLAVTPCLINTRDFEDQSVFDPANLYLLGSPKSNIWTKTMLDEVGKYCKPAWQFVVDPDSGDLRDPLLALEKDGNVYEPSITRAEHRTRSDFGLILRASHPRYNDNIVFILAGRTGLGTAASCIAATTPEHVAELIDRYPKIETRSSPFWAIASARRQKGSLNVDRDSIRIEDAGYLDY